MRKRTRIDTAVLFWNKVTKTKTCWIWNGNKTHEGYGRTSYYIGYKNFKKIPAHRLSYILTYGPIDPRLYCLHKCDNRACVRPGHLFLGTQKDNMVDKVLKNRQAKGITVGSSKLTDNDIHEIRAINKLGASNRQIAKAYKVASSTVDRILDGQIWSHI